MKRLPVILCLLCCCHSYAQLSVDSIKTDVDVETFVAAYGKQNGFGWKNVTVRGMKLLPKDESYISVQQIDSQANKKWLIEDFNNDGKKDLIFNSIIDDGLYFFSLLSNGNIYDFFDLQKWYYHNSPVNLYTLKSDSIILLLKTDLGYVDNSMKWKPQKRTDTLMALWNGFSEFSKKKRKPVQFDTFYFETEPFGYLSKLATDQEKLTIKQDGSAIYSRNYTKFNNSGTDDLSAQYATTISKNTIADLNYLLTLMNIRDMKDSFFVGGSHYPTAKLKIQTGNKIKNIYDYGFQGSYGLRLLYKKLLLIIKGLKASANNYLSEGECWENW